MQQSKRVVGVLGRVVGRGIGIDEPEALLFGAAADQLADWLHRVAAVPLGEGIEAMRPRAGIKAVRSQHRIKSDTAQFDAVAREDHGVVLDVLSDQTGTITGEYRPQDIENILYRQIRYSVCVSNGNVIGLCLLERN